MLRGAACVIGAKAYFNTGGTDDIYCYDYLRKQWTELSACPDLAMSGFALVAINDQLTTVGGTNSNKLFTFIRGKWVEKYPRMSTKRHRPAAVCTGHSLVVAGGCGEQGRNLSTVEVMDTHTLQWFTAESLPKEVYWASITACGDDLYLLRDDSTHVYCCSLQSLLQSRQAPGNGSASPQTSIWNRITGRGSTSQQTSVWTRITDLPVVRSTVVTLCGQLVSTGGRNDKKAVDSIYCYNPATSTWKIIGSIPPRVSCPLVTTLPGDKLIVVYGTGPGDITIAVASAVVS